MESKERFTPGPWSVFFNDGDMVQVIDKKYNVISQHNGLSKKDIANAYLEAAAPEMLEALLSFMKCRVPGGLYKCSPNDNDFEMGDAAIKKALGS